MHNYLIFLSYKIVIQTKVTFYVFYIKICIWIVILILIIIEIKIIAPVRNIFVSGKKIFFFLSNIFNNFLLSISCNFVYYYCCYITKRCKAPRLLSLWEAMIDFPLSDEIVELAQQPLTQLRREGSIFINKTYFR